MAITRANLAVTWNTGSGTHSLTAAVSFSSDAHSLDATCINAQVTVNCDNGGSPAAGDVCDVYLLQTASTGNYDSADILHPVFLGRLDTNTTDPATGTFLLPLPQANFKVRCVSGAASNVFTLSANVTEQRSA